MDLVLGLSMTSADIRWVLVEGATAKGAIGVTWASEAESAVSTFLDALMDGSLANVITVSEQEAADSLAMDIADRGGYRDVAVCIVDPDDALVALVNADGVTTERIDRSADECSRSLIKADATLRRSSYLVRPTTSTRSQAPSSKQTEHRVLGARSARHLRH